MVTSLDCPGAAAITFIHHLKHLDKEKVMEERKMAPCVKCGESSDPLKECLSCFTFFCDKCYPPKTIVKDGIPEIINCCPSCGSGDVEYLKRK
jgi:hypothetical protein